MQPEAGYACSQDEAWRGIESFKAGVRVDGYVMV
jgi:hypothetical protein